MPIRFSSSTRAASSSAARTTSSSGTAVCTRSCTTSSCWRRSWRRHDREWRRKYSIIIRHKEHEGHKGYQGHKGTILQGYETNSSDGHEREVPDELKRMALDRYERRRRTPAGRTETKLPDR